MNRPTATFRFLALGTVLMTTLGGGAQNYHPDVSAGVMPAGMSTSDNDGQTVPSSCYKNGITDRGWTVSGVGFKEFALISPSHSHEGKPQDNRLTIESLTIEPGAVIRWKARSIYPDFPDTYKVIAREKATGTETTLFSGTAPEAFAYQCFDLAEFSGKEVEFVFICNSTNGYLLAVGDLFIGVPDEVSLIFDNRTPFFHADSRRPEFNARLSCIGKSVSLSHATLSVEGMEDIRVECGETLNPGDITEIKTEFDIPYDTRASYTVTLYDTDGEIAGSMTATAFSSRAERVLFVDEGTGMWCDYCASASREARILKSQYPGQVAVVSTHSSDTFAQETYNADMQWTTGFPAFRMNRNSRTSSGSTGGFTFGLYEPTEIALKLTRLATGFRATVCAPDGLDNSDDRYRLAYVVTADFHTTETSANYYQKNGRSEVAFEEYYFLPKIMATHLVKFHDVNIESLHPFDGIAGSIPATLPAGTSSDHMLYPDMDLASSQGMTDATLIAYVLDTETGNIANCAFLALDAPIESTSGMTAEEALRAGLTLEGHTLRRTGGRIHVEIFRPDGILASSLTADDGQTELPAFGGSTMMIAVTDESGTRTVMKAIL